MDRCFTYPKECVVICDGWEIPKDNDILKAEYSFPVEFLELDKYEPSTHMEQPRNVGVDWLNESNFVWFLDSDCLPSVTALQAYREAWHASQIRRIMIGPYEWMAPGEHQEQPQLHNDPRWDMFNEFDADVVKVNDLGMGLGCFSGNLVWPIEEFQQIGGFWDELNMGRCEDGELGLRAASLGVPMSVVREARAYHMGHDVDILTVHAKNERDVPLIHSRHGKVEDTGLKVVNEDGKRLNFICPRCGEELNTILYWNHECQS